MLHVSRPAVVYRSNVYTRLRTYSAGLHACMYVHLTGGVTASDQFFQYVSVVVDLGNHTRLYGGGCALKGKERKARRMINICGGQEANRFLHKTTPLQNWRRKRLLKEISEMYSWLVYKEQLKFNKTNHNISVSWLWSELSL